jgi:hypothetical protein
MQSDEIASTQGRIKVFAGPGQLAFWTPLDQHKSEKKIFNGAAGEIFGQNGPIVKFPCGNLRKCKKKWRRRQHFEYQQKN